MTQDSLSDNTNIIEKSLFYSHQLKSDSIQPIILNNNNENWIFIVLLFL